MKRFDIFPKYLVKAAEPWFAFRNSVCKIFKAVLRDENSEARKKEVEKRPPNTSRNSSRHSVNYLPCVFLSRYRDQVPFLGLNEQLFSGSFSKKRRHLYTCQIIMYRVDLRMYHITVSDIFHIRQKLYYFCHRVSQHKAKIRFTATVNMLLNES